MKKEASHGGANNARKRYELSGRGLSLELGRKTAIMGILNVTPDSFSDGGLYHNNVRRAVARAKQMLEEGADIIDVGGESTRPGSDVVSTEEEIKRVAPVIKWMRRLLGGGFMISVDTRKAEVAQEALEAGANMVNSLSGFSFDRDLASIVSKYKCPAVVYHIRGKPKTMQSGDIAYSDIVQDISEFFSSQIKIAEDNGIKKSQLLIDPGIGFGKNLEQNVALIRRLAEFSDLGLPVVVGVSRKSHLGVMLQGLLGLKEIPNESERLEAALAETAIAIVNGAHIIRTHDVMQTKRFTASLDAILW